MLTSALDVLVVVDVQGDLDTRNTVEIMDLLLKINIERKTTCIMVTHNPDLECYADRILYVEDGQFKHQAINNRQVKLDYHSYMHYINQNNPIH
jgi:putative ABC transport system ATP-binding protein